MNIYGNTKKVPIQQLLTITSTNAIYVPHKRRIKELYKFKKMNKNTQLVVAFWALHYYSCHMTRVQLNLNTL